MQFRTGLTVKNWVVTNFTVGFSMEGTENCELTGNTTNWGFEDASSSAGTAATDNT